MAVLGVSADRRACGHYGFLLVSTELSQYTKGGKFQQGREAAREEPTLGFPGKGLWLDWRAHVLQR
jgi:hypothetical protein